VIQRHWPAPGQCRNPSKVRRGTRRTASDSSTCQRCRAARHRWQATRKAIAALPENQRAVLVLARFEGLSYRQIAERLVLSHRTVQNHVQNTLGKLQLHNRVELTRYAIEQGLD